MFVDDAALGEAVRALRAGDVDPAAYLSASRDRIEAVEPEVRALLPEEGRWDRLERAVEARRKAYPDPESRPPLYGVPVGVKDIFHVDGFETRAGSELPPEALAGEESAAWARLADAGAVPLAKTVTTEFAYFEPGPTANPHDTDRTPGGSSSGSAAAVAAGMCPLAVGTQTIGSVIRPASFCGIVGFKPSFGRIPTDGVIPVSGALDHVGCFTQDVEGARIAASVLCDDWRTLPAKRRRPTLGVPDAAYLEQATETGRERFERQLDALADAGYGIERTDALSDIEPINDEHVELMAAEAAAVHRERGWYPAHEDAYAEATRELLADGSEVPVARVADARRARIERRAALTDRMDDRGIDLWVSPGAPGAAPEGLDTTGDPVMNLPWTNTGLPTVTLPVDETGEGLPLGLQCSARFGADEALLDWAGTIVEDLDGRLR
ncbi:MAG: amidase [Haloarculaceae archaeon]